MLMPLAERVYRKKRENEFCFTHVEIYMSVIKILVALAGVVQWIECWPVN